MPYQNLLLAVSHTKSSPELVKNPGFEILGEGEPYTFSGWYGYYPEVETTSVHSGNRALKITAGEGAPECIRPQDGILITPLKTYIISFWTHGDGINAGRYNVYDDFGYLIDLGTTGVSGPTYSKVTNLVIPSNNATQIGFFFYCPPTISGVAYYDDVSIKLKLG